MENCRVLSTNTTGKIGEVGEEEDEIVDDGSRPGCL